VTRRQLASPDAPLYVFGYGSLMWRPGFVHDGATRAQLVGMHRALCVFSVHYRGTNFRPGLVFGLQAGGACEGMVFRVAPERAAETIAYLNEREMVTGVYRARHRPVQLADGSHRQVQALCYVADPTHPQSAAGLALAEQARVVGGSRGSAGRNIDYVLSTLQHLQAMTIRDPLLERLVTLLNGHCGMRRLGETVSRYVAPPRPYPVGMVPHLPPNRSLRISHRRRLGL
jgi:glutathione-specific gamma-glutamylcyclotransferase